jgi:hypothetical protein
MPSGCGRASPARTSAATVGKPPSGRSVHRRPEPAVGPASVGAAPLQNPLLGLPGDLGEHLEVRVIVENDEVASFRDGSDKPINQGDGPVLSSSSPMVTTETVTGVGNSPSGRSVSWAVNTEVSTSPAGCVAHGLRTPCATAWHNRSGFPGRVAGQAQGHLVDTPLGDTQVGGHPGQG